MALILKELYKSYFWIFSDLRDHRTDDYFLIYSPIQPLLIGIGYLYLIKEILPTLMRSRKPFKLDKILLFFNFAQVLVNGYLCVTCTKDIFNINWYCEPMDYSVNETTLARITAAYIFFLTKIADLLDTVFFILRGKTNQVSFLHVYHHFGMIVLTWCAMRFLPGGHGLFLMWINTFVHTVMYSYYFISAWNVEYKKYVWWKKYITQLQLFQFVFLFFSFGQLLIWSDCTYPKWTSYFIVPQSGFMIILFSDFYRQAYLKKKEEK